MARVRIQNEALDSWDGVNLCLAEIGECQREVEAIEALMQEAIDNAKLEAGIKAEPLRQRITALELQIKAFVDDHSDEMGGKKTRLLQFGQVGYRKSTKVLLPKAAAKVAEIIRSLKNKGMGDCVISPPEKIDKDALKKYPANDILGVGANLKVEDTFWYEIDRESLIPESR